MVFKITIWIHFFINLPEYYTLRKFKDKMLIIILVFKELNIAFNYAVPQADSYNIDVSHINCFFIMSNWNFFR